MNQSDKLTLLLLLELPQLSFILFICSFCTSVIICVTRLAHLTIATRFCPLHRRRSWTGCNMFKMLNATARLVTGTWKYERGLSTLMHDDLQWLVIPQ